MLSRPAAVQVTNNKNEMPTYEYECKKCGKRFEYFQAINERRKRPSARSAKASSSGYLGLGVHLEGRRLV